MAEKLGQRATRDVPDAKAYGLSKAEVEALSESLGKCVNPATGAPVSARREEYAVLPVAGSRTESSDGHGRGTCPLCSAHVALSSKGWVTAHAVRKAPLPTPDATVRLAEKQVEVTDTGARVGSPDAAMRTRDAEVRAAVGTASVKIQVVVKDETGNPVKTPRGKVKTEEVEVPGTPENIRTALRQEQRKKARPEYVKDPATGARKPTGKMNGGPDPKKLAKLGSMLRGVTGLQAVPVPGAEPGTYKVYEAVTLDAPSAPEGREERMRDGNAGHVPTSPGPALVNGRAMSSVPPEDRDRQTSKGKPRNAIGWSGPLGRPRPDRVALAGNPEACEGKGCRVKGCVAIVGGGDGYMECQLFRTLSPTQARRYQAHVTTNKRRREDARRKAAEQAAKQAEQTRAEVKRLRAVGKSLPAQGW